MIEAAIRKRLGGIIITDHDSAKGGLVGKEAARGYGGFKVIPGAEITSRIGHVLAIDVDENIQKGLGVEETVELIHDLGGIAVASHPFQTV
jgi:predicted metal-dependent phosphoesterase TrpH